LVFAFIAFLTARYAATALAVKGDPTKIQINQYVTISTGNAAVALFILALIMAVGVPATLAILNHQRDDSTVTLEMTSLQPDPPIAGDGASTITPVTILSRDFGRPVDVAKMPLCRASTWQNFKISPSPQYNSVDVAAHYDWLNKKFVVTIGNQDFDAFVDGQEARFAQPVKFKKALIHGQQSENDVGVTQPHAVTPAERRNNPPGHTSS
jgi:hypothetical protein